MSIHFKPIAFIFKVLFVVFIRSRKTYMNLKQWEMFSVFPLIGQFETFEEH